MGAGRARPLTFAQPYGRRQPPPAASGLVRRLGRLGQLPRRRRRPPTPGRWSSSSPEVAARSRPPSPKSAQLLGTHRSRSASSESAWAGQRRDASRARGRGQWRRTSVAALAPGGSSLGGGRRTVAAAGGRWRRPESGETMTKSTAIVITMLDMLERPANKRGPTWLTAQKGSAQTSSPHTAVLSGFRSGPKRSGILRPSPVSEESAPEGRNKLFCMHLRCRLRRSIAASDHLCRAHAVSQGFARET